MDSAKLNDWIQAVGILALVASLVFVGLQLNQSQEIALSQASQSRMSATVEIIVSSAENPHFVSSVAKKTSGAGDTLTVEERTAMRQYAIGILYLYEDQHFQYINGFVAEERWQAAIDTLANFLSDESPIPIRATYEEFPGRYNASFQVVINDLIVGIESAAGPK